MGSRSWDSSRIIDEPRELLGSNMLRYEAFRDWELVKSAGDGSMSVLNISASLCSPIRASLQAIAMWVATSRRSDWPIRHAQSCKTICARACFP